MILSARPKGHQMDEMESKCCGAAIEVLDIGSYDPNEDGPGREWAKVQCQSCEKTYHKAF